MIFLDGIPLRKWGIEIQQEHDHPSVPEIRRKTMTIPGMPGEWDFGSELGSRSFSFPLGFIEFDMYEKQRRMNDFVAFLFNSYGQPREMKLTFDYEPDKYYLVKVSSGFSPQRIWGFSFFELPLIASKPFKNFIRSSEDIIMGSDVPIISDILWGTDAKKIQILKPSEFEIINNGSTTLPFSFYLQGKGISISLSGNGKTMKLGNLSNKTIEVTDNFVIKVNGQPDLTISNGVFLELFPGVNKFTISGTDMNLILSEKLVYRYI